MFGVVCFHRTEAERSKSSVARKRPRRGDLAAVRTAKSSDEYTEIPPHSQWRSGGRCAGIRFPCAAFETKSSTVGGSDFAMRKWKLFTSPDAWGCLFQP